MTRLTLSLGAGDSPRLDPLVEGAVRPDGVDLVGSHVHPSELFWRQLHFAEFDVSEFSLSSLFINWSLGNRDWMAIPVFPRREFFHTRIVVRDGPGIKTPDDLRGKRIGVPEYQQTAAVWARGALSDEFGVVAQDMVWYMERLPELSHGGATSFSPPPGVELHHIPPGDSMRAMVERGELDAVLLYITVPTMVDRSVGNALAGQGMHPLFPDPIAEAARYYQKTGICPVNHCIAVRRKLADKHPWLCLNLFHAFDTVRAQVYESFRQSAGLAMQLGFLGTGPVPPEPFPYGMRENRKAIETLIRYQQEQGLLHGSVVLDDVFAPSCMDL